ncbi:MAG: DUF1328 domain-containing protein [Bacteriovoracaceae bacterium]|nr:DUF1328 domain-containing protein [Bacteriovoracaceae bacterium]
MLTAALIFFTLSIVTGLFGFTNFAVASAGIAKILFFLFIILFLVSFLIHYTRKIDNSSKSLRGK